MLIPVEKSKGLTPTERKLANICDQTFLSLWSYPNVYNDKTRRNGKIGTCKEFCDLLVVFENNIILISDKSITYNPELKPEVAWSRYHKKGIQKSVKQLRGAERWIKQHPERIFLDPKCEIPFPIPIDSISQPRFFRIAVMPGVASQVKEVLGDPSSGSFAFCQKYDLEWQLERPFQIGPIDSKPGFVHVLDDEAFQLLLFELDTITDFVNYLQSKENAIEQDIVLGYPAEEDLLGFYLENRDPLGGFNFEKIVKQYGRQGIKSFLLEDGLWESYLSSEARQLSEDLRNSSRIWDEILHSFSDAIVDATMPSFAQRSLPDHEAEVRFLASECRAARSILARQLQDKLRTTPSNVRSSRVVSSPTYPDRMYVFVLFPRDDIHSYDEYRLERVDWLKAYAFVAKMKLPQYKYFVLLGTESGNSRKRSEELVIFDIPELTKQEIAQAKRTKKQLNILNELQFVGNSTMWEKRKRKPSRNQKCPCGSGLKYKKCCGA